MSNKSLLKKLFFHNHIKILKNRCCLLSNHLVKKKIMKKIKIFLKECLNNYLELKIPKNKILKYKFRNQEKNK